MRRRDGSVPPKRTYAEIMEDLNNASDEFKHTMLHQRLVIKAELIRESEQSRDKNGIQGETSQ